MIAHTLTHLRSTILGPNDRMTTSTLTMPEVPVFDATHSQTDVHVWDVAAAHVRYADLLLSRTGGAPFLFPPRAPR